MTWRPRTITIAWHCPACGIEGEKLLVSAARHSRELSPRERELIGGNITEAHAQENFRRTQGQPPACAGQPTWTL